MAALAARHGVKPVRRTRQRRHRKEEHVFEQQIDWDLALIQKYNYSGPRYTSYPTALEFSEAPRGRRIRRLYALS